MFLMAIRPVIVNREMQISWTVLSDGWHNKAKFQVSLKQGEVIIIAEVMAHTRKLGLMLYIETSWSSIAEENQLI